MQNKNSEIVIRLINELRKCLEEDLYLAALSIALQLPDICGKAEYPDKDVSYRYMNWYEFYIGNTEKPTGEYSSDMPYLSGEVIYNLRNSFLHTGNLGVEKQKIKNEQCRIDDFILIFTHDLSDGEVSRVSYRKINPPEIVDRGYSVNVRLLCIKIANAAKSYYNANTEKFDFFTYILEEDDNG